MIAVRRLHLLWPSTVDADRVSDAFRILATAAGTPTMIEARCTRSGIVEHEIAVREGRAASLTSQLRAAIPGLGVESRAAAVPANAYTHAVDIKVNTRSRSLRTDEIEMRARTLLTSMASVGRDEAVSVRWWLLRIVLPQPVHSTQAIPVDSWPRAIVRAPLAPPRTGDAEARQALRLKRSEAGWQLCGQIAVRAATTQRAHQLIGRVADALRTGEGPGTQLTFRRARPRTTPPRRGRLRLNHSELAVLAGWPVARTGELPVERLGSRRVPATRAVATEGRVFGVSSWPSSRPRKLAVTVEDSTRHALLLGPTGTGKSTMALNLIEQDMHAGRAIVVVEPSGDLIKEIVQRIPDDRRKDVVIIDPADDRAVVGLNPLAGDDATADLRADQLLNTLHNLYAANWGPRTSDILSAGLLTLARFPGASLPALPLLLSDAQFRRRIVGGQDDPLGTGPFWAQFEAWSDAERTSACAPVLNKLRPFLVRPRLRHIVGQGTPRFEMGSVFSGSTILLVSLARGELGPEAADLLGSLVLSGIWQRAQERAGTKSDQRRMVAIYLDEFPTYLHLPVDLGDALARARALGVSFTLIAQHLGQLDERMRSAVLANARSQICFQLAPKDAGYMATTSSILGSEDFASLEPFHFYARLMGQGAVQPWCSGMSVAPSKPISNATTVRADALARSAVPAEAVDAALRELFQPTKGPAAAAEFGPRRRKGMSS